MEDNNLNFKSITLKDIAKKCNVSLNTVSRAMRDEKYIKKELYDKIHACAEYYGYVPNKTAIKLKKNPSKKFIAIYNNTIYPFFNSIFYHLNKIMKNEKIFIEVRIKFREFELTRDMASDLISDGAAGVITPYYVSKEVVELFMKNNIILLVIGQDCTSNNVDSVVLDDYNFGYNATSQLIKKGHKKIASVFMEKGTSFFNNRYNGYKQALLDNNLSVNDNYSIWDFMYEYDLSPLINEGVTGFFCFNDQIAFNIYRRYAQNNPNLDVVGIDNISKDLGLPDLFFSQNVDKKQIAIIVKERIFEKYSKKVPLTDIKCFLITK